MTGADPLVSVLMATYNGEEFVAESIESVLAQTYKRIELIAVDDASTDRTPEIVADYARRYPERIRLEQKPDRRGPCRRRNDAIDAARGTVFAWLDQDDLWLPTKIGRQVEVLACNPEVGLVYTGYEAFDSDTGKALPWRERELEAEGDVLAPLFINGCFIASSTTLFRREVMTRRNLRLRERDFSFGDDYFLWLVIALDWRVAHIDEVLARYRRHAQNESVRVGELNDHALRTALLHEFVEEFPEAEAKLGPALRQGFRRHYLNAAYFDARGRRPLSAIAFGLRALRSDPAGTVRSLLMARPVPLRWDERRRKAIIDAFHRLYYDSAETTWSNMFWLGTRIQKCPLDLWIYQEIVNELKPAVIVETGTAHGGSAHLLASLCDLMAHGEVITIDVEPYPDRPAHKRLTYLTGSSTSPETVAEVARRVAGREPVLVILDSDHSKRHVLDELHRYSPLVTPGSYLIVEDTNVNGHPVLPKFGPGPMEAVDEFLAGNDKFVVDAAREKFFLTFNPRGYLRKTIPMP